MTQPWLVPNNLIFLPLGEEALPLLKKGVIPITPVTESDLVWFAPQAQRQQQSVPRVTENEYIKHLEDEYSRLPSSIKSLFDQAAFIKQAETKRPAIEAALLTQRKQRSQAVQGNAEDWLVQRFFTSAYSQAAWQQAGFNKLWLGIDVRHWSQVRVHEVNYVSTIPASYPQCLFADGKENSVLAEQRVVIPRSEIPNRVKVAGVEQGLVRLPPVALRCVLFGATVAKPLRRQFAQYWRTDFRYQRIPLAQMKLLPAQFNWQFQLLEFTRAEKP